MGLPGLESSRWELEFKKIKQTMYISLNNVYHIQVNLYDYLVLIRAILDTLNLKIKDCVFFEKCSSNPFLPQIYQINLHQDGSISFTEFPSGRYMMIFQDTSN